MELDTLAQLGEFVGGFFVIVTLVYLAYQVRQNTRSLRAENYSRILDRISSVQSALSADRDLNRIILLGSLGPEALTQGERARFSWAFYELFGAVEFMFHQAREGAMPEEVWQRWRATISWWVSNPGIELWWGAKPTPFTTSFESLVDELIRDNPYDAAAAGRWQRYVLGATTPTSTAGTSP